MKSRTRIWLFVIFSIVILGLAVFIGLAREGKIKISADVTWQPWIRSEDCNSTIYKQTSIVLPVTYAWGQSATWQTYYTSSCKGNQVFTAGTNVPNILVAQEKYENCTYAINVNTTYADGSTKPFSGSVFVPACPGATPPAPTPTPVPTTPTPTPTITPTVSPTISPTPSPSPTGLSCATICGTSVTATCRITGTATPYAANCANDEINYGSTSDCNMDEYGPGYAGMGKTCCCQTNVAFNLTFTRSGNDLILSWNSIPNAVKYRIYQCNNGLIGETANTSFTIQNIANGEYCYVVMAKDANGYTLMNTNQTTVSVETNTIVVTKEETVTTTSVTDAINLVSTGSNIWINILISLMLIAGVGYFVFRDKIYKTK